MQLSNVITNFLNCVKSIIHFKPQANLKVITACALGILATGIVVYKARSLRGSQPPQTEKKNNTQPKGEEINKGGNAVDDAVTSVSEVETQPSKIEPQPKVEQKPWTDRDGQNLRASALSWFGGRKEDGPIIIAVINQIVKLAEDQKDQLHPKDYLLSLTPKRLEEILPREGSLATAGNPHFVAALNFMSDEFWSSPISCLVDAAGEKFASGGADDNKIIQIVYTVVDYAKREEDPRKYVQQLTTMGEEEVEGHLKGKDKEFNKDTKIKKKHFTQALSFIEGYLEGAKTIKSFKG